MDRGKLKATFGFLLLLDFLKEKTGEQSGLELLEEESFSHPPLFVLHSM